MHLSTYCEDYSSEMAKYIAKLIIASSIIELTKGELMDQNMANERYRNGSKSGPEPDGFTWVNGLPG